MLQKKNSSAASDFFYALLGSVYQTHQVVFLLFDGHITAICDATKLPQFLVLPIYVQILVFTNMNVFCVCCSHENRAKPKTCREWSEGAGVE